MFRHALYQVEYRRAARAAARAAAPAPPRLVRRDRGMVTWELAMPTPAPTVFMRAEGDPSDVDAFVVHVAGDAFYLAMLRAVRVLRTSAHGRSCMARADMHRDYKFHHAVNGFARTNGNPVPLAEPVIGKDRRGQVVVSDFQNGITRTYWLLANGCPAFPVLVQGEAQAELLATQAGVGLQAFRELFAA